MPSPIVRRYAPSHPEDDKPPRLLQAPEQEEDVRDMGGSHFPGHGDMGGSPTLRDL